MSETATLRTWNVRMTDHPIGYKNGINSVMNTEEEARSAVKKHNNASHTRGEKSMEPCTQTVYKGTLKPESITQSNLSDNVIAHYELHKDGYDAPATVNSMKEDELPEEAWFIYHMGGFTLADRFGEIIEE